MNLMVALETATDMGSVAIGRGSELIGEAVIGRHRLHAETLLPSLDFLMRSAGVQREEIDGIVVGAGPGSFTGVRIAAAAARGLAHGLGVPLYAYSSLAALAADADSSTPVCAMFDARRGEVYAACFVSEGRGQRMRALLQPAALTVAELRRRVASHAPRFVGEGAVRYAAELGIAAPSARWPRASALLRLAAADPEGGRVTHLAGWEPSYLRESGAERGISG